jgi:putative adhesin
MIRSALNFLPALGIVALTATACGIQAQSLSVDGAFDRTLRVEGPIDLDVLSRSGHIRVAVGSNDAVRVTGHIRAYGSMRLLNSYTASEQARKLETNPPIEQSAGRITIGYIADDALASNVRIDYDLTVPQNTRLRTSTRSGDQTIDAIQGPVTATSRSGEIHIGSVRGDLDVETRSGDIELVDQHSNVQVQTRSGRVRLDGQPPRRWDVQTRSGDVEVALTRDAGAEVDIESRSGSIDSNRPIERRSRESRHRMQGVIGSGGGSLQVTTRSGSVQIR